MARENPSATNVVPKLNPDGSQQKNSRDPNAFLDEHGNYRRPDKPPPPDPKFVPPEDASTDPTRNRKKR